MTDEEKLQEYLRDNAPKSRKKEEDPQPEVVKPVIPKSKKKPIAWYRGRVAGDFFGVMLFATFFPAVALGVMENNGTLTFEEAWAYGFLVIGSAVAFMIFLSIYKMNRYTSWLNNKYYKISGWNEFFEKRTDEFWSQRNYTTIRISFNLTENATDLHREALKAFTAKIIRKWNKQYQDKDLEWIGSIPKDLQSNGSAIYGDISQRELMWMLKIMNPRFIPLSKLLRHHLQDVVLKSDSKERQFEMKEVKDDPSDRADSWMRRHSD